jgi:hypothetical protein
MSNTWPNGERKAMTQTEHAHWNANNYPGTLEICYWCDSPTGNCEEDNIEDKDGNAICNECDSINE